MQVTTAGDIPSLHDGATKQKDLRITRPNSGLFGSSQPWQRMFGNARAWIG